MTLILMTLLAPDTYAWLIAVLLTFLTGLVLLRCRRNRRKRLRLISLLFLLLGWYVLLYGTFVGVGQLEVRQEVFVSKDLPAAFDGYRIVQFSDTHVGTYTGWRQDILRRAVDTILAQNADLIVFTGDLQNKLPEEIVPHLRLLSTLHAPDGVYSVLGNHDYAKYVKCSEEKKAANCRETRRLEQQMGWTLLLNEHRTIRRGNDSIVIAGMENDGEGRFPQLGDIPKTLGYPKKARRPSPTARPAFTVMLEHDPTSWQRKILPQSDVQLTLSGHTHGGQFSLLGWTPAMLRYQEWGGMYYQDGRAMNVSTGLGGVIPIRFGVTPEIVVITLKIEH